MFELRLAYFRLDALMRHPCWREIRLYGSLVHQGVSFQRAERGLGLLAITPLLDAVIPQDTDHGHYADYRKCDLQFTHCQETSEQVQHDRAGAWGDEIHDAPRSL